MSSSPLPARNRRAAVSGSGTRKAWPRFPAANGVRPSWTNRLAAPLPARRSGNQPASPPCPDKTEQDAASQEQGTRRDRGGRFGDCLDGEAYLIHAEVEKGDVIHFGEAEPQGLALV